MKVSYCSTCKGRLWQLQRTFLANLEKLKTIDAEWIILDYASPDDFASLLMLNETAVQLMAEGKLKIYQHQEAHIPFSMPLAKNLAHHFATGEFVFNLDIDNFIGNSYEQIQKLSPKEFIRTANQPYQSGTEGRLGMYRKTFLELGGYDLDLFGAGYDDINLTKRLGMIGLVPYFEKNIPGAVKNTREETTTFVEGSTTNELYRNAKAVHDKKIKVSPYVNHAGMTMYEGVDLALATHLLTPQ